MQKRPGKVASLSAWPWSVPKFQGSVAYRWRPMIGGELLISLRRAMCQLTDQHGDVPKQTASTSGLREISQLSRC